MRIIAIYIVELTCITVYTLPVTRVNPAAAFPIVAPVASIIKSEPPETFNVKASAPAALFLAIILNSNP